MITRGARTGLQAGLRAGLDPAYAVSAPSFQAAGSQASSAGTIQPGWPTHVVGDIGLLWVKTQGDQAATLSDPQGFLEVPGSVQGVGTGVGSTRVTTFWARATSESMTAPTVADTGNHHIGRIVTARGCVREGAPWDVFAGDTGASDTAVSIPGATTTRDLCLIFAVVCDGFDGAGARASSAANASLSDVTERADDGSAAGTGGGLVVISGVKAVRGAYSATTCTLANAGAQARMSIALRSY